MLFLWPFGTPFPAAGPPWRRGVRQLRASAALEDEPRGPVSDVALDQWATARSSRSHTQKYPPNNP